VAGPGVGLFFVGVVLADLGVLVGVVVSGFGFFLVGVVLSGPGGEDIVLNLKDCICCSDLK
jgi:hypothetical protein